MTLQGNRNDIEPTLQQFFAVVLLVKFQARIVCG